LKELLLKPKIVNQQSEIRIPKSNMSRFPQHESARGSVEVRQRRIACRKRLRRRRAAPKSGSYEVSGLEHIEAAPRIRELNERRAAEDYEGVADNAEALDEACAGIRG
jgi:hypothetical protein